MQSSLKPKSTDDPHDLVRVSPSDAEITDLLRAAARHRSDAGAPASAEPPIEPSVPAVDATFRATAVNDDIVLSRGPMIGRRTMRGIIALLLALGIGGAALTWQTFGYAAKKAMIKWLPQLAVSSSLPLDKLGLGSTSTPASEPAEADATSAPAAAQSAPAAAETAAADTAAQPASASQAAAPPADSAQLLQSMARDLANVSQEVETLKASIAELKANQQQMAHDLAKAAEQNARPKLPPVHAPVAARKPAPVYAPTPTASVPAYRPTPPYPPAQAAAAPASPPPVQPYVPAPPVQLPSSDPGVTSVPRPPMPVQ